MDDLASNSLSSNNQRLDLDPTWVRSIQNKLKKEPRMLKKSAGGISCWIHRVPHCWRQHDEKSYSPQVVFLGPFHRHNQMLQAMEEHKWRYLDAALSRAACNGLNSFLRGMKILEPNSRACYSQIIDLDSNEFAEMMMLDGCFILQILLTGTGVLVPDSNDPIFRQSWFMDQLARDFLMLENQVPFFVLERLFGLMAPSMQPKRSLAMIALTFFNRIQNFDPVDTTNPKHLLHLLQSNLLPKINGPSSAQASSLLKPFPCATQLQEAGVKFKRGNANSFLDVRFEGGVIEMPPLSIQDGIKSLLLNLAAFEQCYPYCGQNIRAYTFFVDCLINSAEDVRILCRSGIIENWLGSDEEVADLFNKLGRDAIVSPHDFYLANVFERINCYCRTPWHAWRASLMHKYFYNPWAIFSLVGALMLLFLTLIQTVFAGYSYSRPPS